MHINEGVLTVSSAGMGLLAGGAALAAAGTAIGLRRMDYERVPQVAMLSAAFFVASLIHVPLGPAEVHLVLNGLAGLVLGWAAFPAILIALVLQLLLFGMGGVTTLGINTVVMALPAVTAYYACNRSVRAAGETTAALAGFAAGALGIVLGATLLSAALLTTGAQFERIAEVVLVAHLPVAVVEGFVTSAAVVFLRKVRPELLEAPLLAPIELEIDG